MARMIGIEQNSPAWVVARVGCVTASRVEDVVAKLKDPTKEAKQRYHYRLEKVMETITGRAANHMVNDAMRWGMEHQELARTEYELRNDVFVDPGGFWML